MSSQERIMSDEKMIISKTDTKGQITYVNAEFCRISGYKRPELLGNPHSMIRHQGMPRGVFKCLWQTLQDGKEFNGFIKNICKGGDYYWVFATVTPWLSSDGQSLLGYMSARRKANREGVEFFSRLYEQMLEQEAALSGAAAPEASLKYLLDACVNKGVSYDELAVQYQTR